jgi:hypothetical protein
LNRLPKDWKHLEEIVNKALGLSDTKGSGNVHSDGDGKGWSKHHDSYDLLMAECKFTEKNMKSVSFKKNDFRATEMSARRFGRMPVMATYQEGDKTPYIHMSLKDFAIIYQNHLKYTEHEEE